MACVGVGRGGCDMFKRAAKDFSIPRALRATSVISGSLFKVDFYGGPQDSGVLEVTDEPSLTSNALSNISITF